MSENLPIAENFKHTSPYGTLARKKQYMDLVESNRDKFLGNHFEILDEIYDGNKACVRYTVSKRKFFSERN